MTQADHIAAPGVPIGVKAIAPRLTFNQWKVLCVCALAGMLETMDIYIIGFVLAVITGPWKLSYGVSAIILLASGAGAILGSLAWGHIADTIGRKKAFLATIITCSAASVALAFTPTGDWVFLVIMRAVLGFGAGGFFIFIMLVQEFAPATNRGFASGVVSTAAAGGLVLGAIAGSFLMPIIGWRGMFAIGVAPAVVGTVVMFLIPESPRWALARGDAEMGRKSLRWALGPDADIEPIVASYGTTPTKPGWSELLSHPRSLIVGPLINFGVVTAYYGTALWAPTLLAQVLNIPGSAAAKIMVGISLSGLLCRLLTGILADRFGRRRCGAVAACGAGILLVFAGLVGHGDILSRDLFWLPFALAFILADSSFAVMAMYTSEIWPSRLRGRGCGVSYGVGSIGKIAGPLGLAIVVGSSNMIKPAATVNSIVTAFAFLATMFLMAGMTYLFLARETKGQTLEGLEKSAAGG